MPPNVTSNGSVYIPNNPSLRIFSEPMDRVALHPSKDYLWTQNEEPHLSRRIAMLKKYPEIKKLYGYDPITKYIVGTVVFLQLFLGFYLRNELFSFRWWFIAYFFGATCDHFLFLAVHEISHNLAFKSIWANRLLNMYCNLPIVFPFTLTFKEYHLDHHKSQGIDGIDVDLPTALEGKIFRNLPAKFLFCTFQIFFYAFRPMIVNQKPPTALLMYHWIAQIIINSTIIYFFGFAPIIYWLTCVVLGGSIHPCAGHFISEHYVFATEQETISYYGPLNWLSLNVGYHNEHHDFPNIPWRSLPRLREIAPEFYNTMPYHMSWSQVLWRFITDPQISILNRVKRRSRVTPSALKETLKEIRETYGTKEY